MGTIDKGIVWIIVCVCMLMCIISALYIFKKYKEQLYKERKLQTEIMNQKAEIYRLSQIYEMNEIYKEMVHNTSHYYKVIGEMAVEHQNEEIYNLVKELDESFEKNIVKEYSNYKILNILLAEKEAKANKSGVRFDAYVEQGTDMDSISDMDMITMIGNLLDNAVVAAAKKKGESIVKVRIFMQNEGSNCVVKIVNDYDGKLVIKGQKLISTKIDEGLHGLGVTSVNRVAEKYNGFLRHYIEDNQFVAVLILPVIR